MIVKLKFVANETFLSHYRLFPDIYVSQSSVATRMRCGGVFNDRFIICLLLSPMVKEFRKSVNMWQSYGQE